MKKYLIIIVALIVAYIFTIPKDSLLVSKDFGNHESVLVSYNDEKLSMPIDDYVLGVLACEMPALFNEEALKAGAIAIRTFYEYNKLKNNDYVAKTSEQCFINEEKMKEKWGIKYDEYYNKLSNVVNETKNQFITYDDEIIPSFYFSLSNGYTENADEVFSVDLPYLVTTESLWDKNVKTFENNMQIELSSFLSNLGILDEDYVEIKDIVKTESGRVKTITINDKVFTGIEIRKLLNLRSADFEIEILDKEVNVKTKGYGHGVGMSQYGANEMAKLGYKYDEILYYYYKDTKISKLDV